jgi:uncharacterized protein YukE
MSELWVDPEGLKRSAKGFTKGAQQLKKIHDQLDGKMSAEGKCWGADDTGKQFEADYLKPSQDVLKLFGELSKGLSDIKTGLDKMAKVYEKAEESATGTVRGVGRG